MTPHRFQRFLVLCRCYSGAAGACCARPGASWWPPYEDVGMGSRRTPMAAPLRESPPRRNRKHRRGNAENRMTPHRFQRFLVLCRCYSGATGACCARPGASLWRPHDSFGKVRAGPRGRSAEKISAQTHSEASMESAGPLPIPCSSAGDQSEAGSIGVGDGDKSLDDGTLVSQNAGERPTILRDLAMSVPSCVLFSHQ